jgi:alpha-glucuronidase
MLSLQAGTNYMLEFVFHGQVTYQETHYCTRTKMFEQVVLYDTITSVSRHRYPNVNHFSWKLCLYW